MNPRMAPKVSIVTPAYNAERFLAKTIESAQEQTFRDWEMIISDDCSSDRTREIASDYAKDDPRIRLLSFSENRGPALARGAAFDAARGRYLAFLDSDDLWVPHKLETQLEFMESTGSAFSFTQYRYIDEGGRLFGKLVDVKKQVDYQTLLKNTIIGCLTVMLDREKTGPLRVVSMQQHVDIVIWYDLLRKGMVANGIPEDLARYRLVQGSISRNKAKAAAHMWEVYRKVERLGVLESAWCFSHYAWNAFRKNLVL